MSSLKTVIGDLFYSDIYDIIEAYVCDHCREFSSGLVYQAEDIELDTISIHSVKVRDKKELEIDIIVVADLIISETFKRDRNVDSLQKWFKVSCRDWLKIKKVEPYEQKERTTTYLNQDMAPIIPKENFEEEATRFLAQFCPEALVKPMPLPIDKIINKMGLIKKEIRLSRHMKLFGQIMLEDGVISSYNDDKKIYETVHVKKGTIVIDPAAYFMRNIGNINNTIIHECFHWYRHRKYYEIKELCGEHNYSIKCRVDEPIEHQRRWNSKEWMEWQANGITPRILMPKEPFIRMADKLLGDCNEQNILDKMECLICELSEFFCVSKLATKIRLIDLGYNEARGVLNYSDGKYVESYRVREIEKDESYTIGVIEAFQEYYGNLEFRKIIDTGMFVYIDGHYVLNDPKYVKQDGTGLDMTPHARMHIEECCLVFTLKHQYVSENVTPYIETALYRTVASPYKSLTVFQAKHHNMDLFNKSEELKRFHQELLEESQIKSQTTQNFAQLAAYHIKRKGFNKIVFMDRTLLSDKTYDRIMKNQLPTPALETVMSVCIGLELGIVYGEELLEAAGFTLRNMPRDIAYRKLLTTFAGHSIYECNEILEALNLPVLNAKQYQQIRA